MKQFIAKRTEDGAELQQVPTEKIKVYKDTFTAEQALDDLQVGEVIATKDNSYNTGLPLGSVISLDGDILPAGFLKCDGSRFDTNKYPLLAAYLGSNKTPVLFDHSKLSDWVNGWTSGATAEYDGFIYGYSASTQNGNPAYIVVNGVTFGIGNADSATLSFTALCIPFRKGDVVSYVNLQAVRVCFYKKPLVIKATEGGYEKSDYVYSLLSNIVQEYKVSGQNANQGDGSITFGETIPIGKYQVTFTGADHAQAVNKFCEFNEKPITTYFNDGSAIIGGFGPGSTQYCVYSGSGLLEITEPTNKIYYHNTYSPLAVDQTTLTLTRISL